MSTEIERKFLVAEVPTTERLGVGQRMRQGYLADEGDVSTRIRIMDDTAVLTVKAGRGRSRTEVEFEIPVEEAEQLWQHTGGRRLEKVRYRIAVDGGVAELDVYEGELDGLLTVEVEFDDDAAADGFVPPQWFGSELTDDERWTNASLARHGRPT